MFYFKTCLASLSRLCDQPEEDFEVCLEALLRRGFGSSKTSSHERLERGDVVQLLLHEKRSPSDAFLHVSFTEQGKHTYAVIGGFFKSKDGTAWAVVETCKIITSPVASQIPDYKRTPLLSVETEPFYSRRNLGFHFLKLDS